MKYFVALALLLLQFNVWAQVKGNKQIVTKTYPLQNLTSLDINLYAEVEVDCYAKEEITITADGNLLDLIEKELANGHLKLTQKEWIQSSQKIKLTIGAPNLERIQHSVHETTQVRNIDRASFSAMAIIGKLVLQGKVEDLSASGEIGEIDAQALQTKTVDLNLWSHGKIELGNPEQITGLVKDDGQVVYNSKQPKLNVNTKNGGRIYSKSATVQNEQFDTRYIDFKVKNNSLNRINCYVKGPKPDGSFFSYGFPMNPGQVRNKNWTIGSKVYRLTSLGTKKLLAEVVASDEGNVVKLYQQ